MSKESVEPGALARVFSDFVIVILGLFDLKASSKTSTESTLIGVSTKHPAEGGRLHVGLVI